MLWFLNLFPGFRALSNELVAEQDEVARLREELQATTTEKLILQDRMDAVLNDRGNLWEMVKEAIANERISYQMHVNVQWQKEGRSAPWPDAPQMPHRSVPQNNQDPIGRKPFPSEAVAQQTRSFIADYVESLTPKQ
jgi:hypothetical protein